MTYFNEAHALSENAVEPVWSAAAEAEIQIRFWLHYAAKRRRREGIGDPGKDLEYTTAYARQWESKLFHPSELLCCGSNIAHPGRLDEAEYVRLEQAFPI